MYNNFIEEERWPDFITYTYDCLFSISMTIIVFCGILLSCNKKNVDAIVLKVCQKTFMSI